MLLNCYPAAYVWTGQDGQTLLLDPREVTVTYRPAEVVISPEEANHVLAHYGEGGYRAGSFTMALIEVMVRADPANLARLALGFPGHAAAVHLARDTDDGIAALRDLAARRATTHLVDGQANG